MSKLTIPWLLIEYTEGEWQIVDHGLSEDATSRIEETPEGPLEIWDDPILENLLEGGLDSGLDLSQFRYESEYGWLEFLKRGKDIPIEGERRYYKMLELVPESSYDYWSGATEWDYSFEWEHSIRLMPANYEHKVKRELAYWFGKEKRAGGFCEKCKTELRDHKEPGRGWQFCRKCAKRRTEHEAQLAKDPLYDLRQQYQFQRKRVTGNLSQQDIDLIEKRSLELNEKELHDEIARLEQEHKQWLAYWDSMQ